ncbi:MAG: precorrin-3B C(17)-methyltransferase [Andreesenia angusta]|nr:precorrin-3B C(17)-methyltransferase [Andreesenia angusta]
MKKLFIVGIGPGSREHMTLKAVEILKKVDTVVGYNYYIDLIRDLIEDKEIISTGMRGEIERCKLAIEAVKNGKDTAIISTGDAGIYGMAGPIYEMAKGIDIEVVPGVTAAFSAASELGAPIMHDFAIISLSDLLTPWELIKSRIEAAAKSDFVISLYNPRSKNRQSQIVEAFEIISKYKDGNTPVGIVRHSGRKGREIKISTVKDIDFEEIDMMTVIIIGNKESFMRDGKIITPRGYDI